jgi:hypothetical protein
MSKFYRAWDPKKAGHAFLKSQWDMCKERSQNPGAWQAVENALTSDEGLECTEKALQVFLDAGGSTSARDLTTFLTFINDIVKQRHDGSFKNPVWMSDRYVLPPSIQFDYKIAIIRGKIEEGDWISLYGRNYLLGYEHDVYSRVELYSTEWEAQCKNLISYTESFIPGWLQSREPLRGVDVMFICVEYLHTRLKTALPDLNEKNIQKLVDLFYYLFSGEGYPTEFLTLKDNISLYNYCSNCIFNDAQPKTTDLFTRFDKLRYVLNTFVNDMDHYKEAKTSKNIPSMSRPRDWTNDEWNAFDNIYNIGIYNELLNRVLLWKVLCPWKWQNIYIKAKEDNSNSYLMFDF